MNSADREKFWNVLKNLHDSDEENVKGLILSSPWPKYLCRFRPASENALKQLNDNRLFFSSANHYDDPFDTYFCINLEQMIPAYKEMRKALYDKDEMFLTLLRKIAVFAGQDPDKFVDMLSAETPDFTETHGKLLEVRTSIQKRLFSICFCENPYNETLWLKYAQNYSGFVQVYDMEDPNTFLCGKDEACRECSSAKARPNIYPVYYSDERYDATQYALGVYLMEKINQQNDPALKPLWDLIVSRFMWEPERISLIKKKCHEYDQEWRMIRPTMSEQRSFIKMKPSKVIIGLRTPECTSRKIVSAAVNAGISEIHKLYINDSDQLDSKPVPNELYRI